MKRALKYILFALAGVVVLIVGGIGYIKVFLPNVGAPPDLKVEVTPERVKRGEYLANHVAACMDCHATRDWERFAAPPIAGTLGKGGEAFTEEFGLPGNFYAPNITPHHLGSWTDGEIFRAITAGVSKDGRPLFPIMPHPNYGKSDKEDILDIIAYLRSLQAIKNEVPVSNAKFPMSIILHTIPQKPTFATKPNKSNTVEYGKYLVQLASCAECHTPAEKGQPKPGMDFAGGQEFKMPGGIVRPANISQDQETGIGSWTREQFFNRFSAFKDSAYQANYSRKLKLTDTLTLMPWTMYAGMDSTDLSAIYDFLRTVKPVKNKVAHFTAK